MSFIVVAYDFPSSFSLLISRSPIHVSNNPVIYKKWKVQLSQPNNTLVIDKIMVVVTNASILSPLAVAASRGASIPYTNELEELE